MNTEISKEGADDGATSIALMQGSNTDPVMDVILRARKSVQEKSHQGSESVRMTKKGHSSFDRGCKGGRDRRARRSDASTFTAVEAWAETGLRLHGSQLCRAWMAVRDAARMAESKVGDPFLVPFYVAKTIAHGWNLTPRQLSNGLKELEKIRAVTITERRKGRHVRMTLARGSGPSEEVGVGL